MITDPPPDRIQWHEGMLLSPQHFQQEAARVDALVAWHTLASSPYSWGIRRLELDQSLRNELTYHHRISYEMPARLLTTLILLL
jgi:hypothetical protein